MAACNPAAPVVDERLRPLAAAAGTEGTTGVGADGGFLIPPQWQSRVRQHMDDVEALLPRTDNITLSGPGNSMTFPADETTAWGTDGVRAYWTAEATAATLSKPALKERTMRAHKLLALVPVTDELMSDAASLESWLVPRIGRSIRWKTNDALINGTGAGQPRGILNAAALVSVAKEGSQAADTIQVENVAKMFARMPTSSLGRAVWHINPDVWPQIITMTLSNQAIFMGPSGAPESPAGTLLGRPIIPLESCQTLGDKGDIYFVDWSAYVTLTKSGGITFATSIHLYFDAEETAFRASFRVDGQPWLNSSITPANGSANRSPFVTLAERA